MESLTGQDTSKEAKTDFSRVFPNLTKNPDNKRELPWHYTENDVGELCLTLINTAPFGTLITPGVVPIMLHSLLCLLVAHS